MAKLLILACSGLKADHPTRAIELYDGPAFRTLRAWAWKMSKRAATRAKLETLHVWVLSAEHGLIPWDMELEPYDRLMSYRRAAELQAEVAPKLRELVAELQPEEVFLMMGRGYLRALPEDLTQASGGRRVVFPEGGIGTKLGTFKRWLTEVA